MTKGERDISTQREKLQNPCHWLFDLTVRNTSAFDLEVDSVDLIPNGARNIRPISVGTVVQETYNFADPKHPVPVREIHTHELGEGEMSSLGFRWTTTKEERVTGLESLKFRRKHPLSDY